MCECILGRKEVKKGIFFIICIEKEKKAGFFYLNVKNLSHNYNLVLSSY